MRKCVAVVDDDNSMSAVLAELVRVLGHEPRVFRSPAQCLEWLGDHEADLGLFDLNPHDRGVSLHLHFRPGALRGPDARERKDGKTEPGWPDTPTPPQRALKVGHVCSSEVSGGIVLNAGTPTGEPPVGAGVVPIGRDQSS